MNAEAKINYILYNTNSERICVTKALTQVAEGEGVVQPPFDVLNPTVILKSSAIPKFNYMYIEETDRFYYAGPPQWLGGNGWSVSLQSDPLMTWNSGIRNLNAYVGRCQSEYDTELSDTAAPTKVRTKFSTVKGGAVYSYRDAMSTWTLHDNVMKNDGACYIIGLNVSYFTYTGSDTQQFPPEGIMYISCTYGMYRQLMERLKFYSASWFANNVLNYDLFTNMVKDVYVLPYAPSVLGEVDKLYVYSSVPEAEVFNQSLPLSEIGTYYVVNHTLTPTFMWRVPVDMDIEFPYKNTTPFREISCEFWPLGVCSLDTSVMSGLGDPVMNLCFWCETSSLTGQTQFYYGALSEDDDFSLENVQASCRLPLGQTNVRYDLPVEGGQGNNVRIISSAAAAISGGMDAGDYGKKNPNPAPPKAFTTMSNIATGAGALAAGWEWASSSLYPPSTFSVNGNVTTTLVSTAPRLLIMSKEQLDIPESIIGRPLFQIRRLGDLSGYVQTQEVHVDGFPCFAEEQQEIESMLKAGVIL